MNHIMLDIETLGTKPGCAILSIGAVRFDMNRGIQENYYNPIKIESNAELGLLPEFSTIAWWLQQNEKARAKAVSGIATIQQVLEDFRSFIVPGDIVYGNSASFDCAILAEAYRRAGIKLPWHYRNERCYRTLVNTHWRGELPDKDPNLAHDPIYDCQYQISNLMLIHQSGIKLD